MLQIQKRHQDGPIEIILFGTYADRLVKTRDGWRFKERIFRSDTLLVRPTSDGPKREPRKHDQRQQRWTLKFGQLAKVESRPRKRSLECHGRDGVIPLS